LKATELLKGQKATISSITQGSLSTKLMEMGCIPGTPIMLEFKAPGGDPMAFNVDGYLLGLRISEATYIEVDLNEN
jgi:ferrous iron transport protein A